MSTKSEQIAALDELARFYLVARTPRPPFSRRYTAAEFKRLYDFELRQADAVEAIKRRLLASGYPVPNSWLTVEYMVHPQVHGGAKPTITLASPPAEPLKIVSDEIYVAMMRLRFESGTEQPPLTSRAMLRQAQLDIIGVIREAGRRLTTTQILDALANRGLQPSEGGTKTTLAELVRFGELTNSRAARPPGYGLPEWEQSTVPGKD